MKSKIRKIFTNLEKIKEFFKKTETKIIYFVVPTVLSIMAAFFEGVGIAALFPLLKGIFQKDFTFIRELPVIKYISSVFPSLFFYPNSSIYVLLVITVFLTLVASSLMRYLASVAIVFQLKKFSDRMRRLIFSRYLEFGKMFFDRSNAGYLQNVLLGFTNQIANELKSLHNALNQFFSLIIYLILMFFVDYRLTLLMFLLMPLLYYSFKWLIKKIKKTSYIYADSYKKANEGIHNILSCISLVKLYGMEDKEKGKFLNISDTLRKLEFSLEKKYNLLYPVQEIIFLVVILLLVSIISFMVIKEKSGEISNFLIFFYLLKKTATNFNFFNIIKTSIASVSGPIYEVMKIFDDKNKFFIAGGQKEFYGLQKNIEIKNLNFSYIEGINVLTNVNFSIEKDKIVAIVGHSGAGKTTLINLLLRLYECPDASIFIDGADIKEFTLDSIRRHIALVSQEALLFNDTLRNNIIYGLSEQIPDQQLFDILRKAKLYDYVMKLPDKLDAQIGDRGVKLSGGEKQRIAIARALLKGAEIIILDEATSSLDSITETLIREAIHEAISGKTTIVIAHRLSTIKNADKIIVLEDGKFIEDGALEELIAKKGRFYQYWESQKFY